MKKIHCLIGLLLFSLMHSLSSHGALIIENDYPELFFNSIFINGKEIGIYEDEIQFSGPIILYYKPSHNLEWQYKLADVEHFSKNNMIYSRTFKIGEDTLKLLIGVTVIHCTDEDETCFLKDKKIQHFLFSVYHASLNGVELFKEHPNNILPYPPELIEGFAKIRGECDIKEENSQRQIRDNHKIL